MAEPLENLARRLENDPFFLACPLRLAANSRKLDDRELAEKLGCSSEVLVQVRLCRAPAGDASQFQRDVARIVDEFKIDSGALIEAVRLGQAIFAMRQDAPSNSLLAARDVDEQAKAGGGET